MRLAAKTRMGFYPIPEKVIEMIASHLAVTSEEAVLMDPCAGEGVAVHRLAELLGIAPDRVCACELDRVRSEALSKRLPLGMVRKETDWSAARFDGAVSLMYCNPPFDDEFGGGGRVESRFLSKAAAKMRPKSVLVFVAPLRLSTDREFIGLLSAYYENITKVLFPYELRKFSEAVWFAVRRGKPSADMEREQSVGEEWSHVPTYAVPAGRMPSVFEPGCYSTAALIEAANASGAGDKLNRMTSAERSIRPPLKLGKGHLALLLAGGHLNGVVEKDGRPPHVVRGTAMKEEFQKSTEVIETEDGSKRKTVISQRIQLTVRYVEGDGKIRTLQDSIAEAEREEETNESE